MKQHKRILVVSQHYWPENFRITDLCAGFLSDNIEVDVLCGLPNYPKGEWFSGYRYSGPRRETHDGVTIFRAGEIRRKGNTGARIFLNYVSFPFFALFSLPRLHGRRYDAVFCYETSPVLMMLPAILYAKTHHVPLTTYVLDLWPENLYSVLPVQNKLLRTVADHVSHWHYRRSEQLIAMSPALAERLSEIAPKACVTSIPQYSEDFYAQHPDATALKARFPAAFNVLFAGNFSPAQDLGLLVQCAERLRHESRTEIHFVLVGDGMSREALLAEIAEKGLSPWFTWEGAHPPEDIPAYQAMADAQFAALAKSADLGLTVPGKIPSYLAAGKPCLVAIDGEGARVIAEADAGLVCGAGDANALYENLLNLAAMPQSKRAALGKNAFDCYEKNFSRAGVLSTLERFIFKEQENASL